MKKKSKNEVKIAGYVYQNNQDSRIGLSVKTVQNANSANYGKEFISGNLDIAVDEDGMNVITVHFMYVTADNEKKKDTFNNLKKIIQNPDKNWIMGGKENAFKVSVTGTLELNEFISNRTNEIVSAIRIEGGFLNMVNGSLPEPKKRNTFSMDMLINKVNRVEANPEKNIDKDFVRVGGAVFNFRNELLPVTFVCRNEQGMACFEDMDASVSNPTYTNVWGRINCMTIKTERVTESAFGEPEVQTYENKQREWLITGMITVPYEFGDESVMTAEDLKKAVQDREVKLAGIRRDKEEYEARKASSMNPKIQPKMDTSFDF